MPRSKREPTTKTKTAARKAISHKRISPPPEEKWEPQGREEAWQSGLLIPTARETVGLTFPLRQEKLGLWSLVRVPSAGIEGGYTPLASAVPIHFHPARFKCGAGGARVGKSLIAAMEGVAWTTHSDLIWIVGPDYEQARREFIYTMEGLISLDFVDERSISLPSTAYLACAMETRWGCVIQTKTASDIEKLAAEAPDLIIACEPGQMPSGVLFRFYERLTTKRGTLFMMGTFEESHPWYTDVWSRWKDWPNDEGGKSFSIPMWANIHSFPLGRNDPEILRMEHSLTGDLRAVFLARVAGLPVTSYQLVFGNIWQERLSDGSPYHVRKCPFQRFRDPESKLPEVNPVEFAIDPGFSPSKYAVCVIQWDKEASYQIDEVIMEGALHSQVIQECMRRPWWANVTRGVMDPYAATNHPFGGLSPAEVWHDEAHIIIEVPQRLAVADAVDRHAFFLYDTYQDRARHFVDPRCTHTIYEYNHWRKASDKGTGHVQSRPSDRYCDALKAKNAWFIYHYQNRVREARRWGPRVRDLQFIEVA